MVSVLRRGKRKKKGKKQKPGEKRKALEKAERKKKSGLLRPLTPEEKRAVVKLLKERYRIPKTASKKMKPEHLMPLVLAAKIKLEKGGKSAEFKKQIEIADEIFGSYKKMIPLPPPPSLPPRIPFWDVEEKKQAEIQLRIKGILREKGKLPGIVEKRIKWVQSAYKRKIKKEYRLAIDKLLEALERSV